MQDARHIEHYEFHCQPCGTAWHMSYEVRAVAEQGTEETQFFYLTGLPATPPADGRLCPNCWTPSFSCRKVDEPALVPSRH